MSTHCTFRDLDVWQTAMELARAVYRATQAFPEEERFGMTGQLRRAAVSVPCNIAEGSARRSGRDFARFIAIAEGSLRETETLWLLGQELGYADSSPKIDDLLDRSGRMLNRLRTVTEQRYKATN